MSKLATIELTGNSCTKYTFDVYSYGSVFSKISCIYFISKREINNDNKFVHDIFFIGKTDDISKEISAHPKKSCFEQNNSNCISIYISNSETEKEHIMYDLIKRYVPKCNDSLP
ncbi:MAG: hypothetical protein COX07_09540 [Bacteroidetes bacterium CG23_combo_of_CG06-09_8_20_14_all_32_9]|nr:MAG: hypothetical protein COX07_09540 [Bacteroidetes bacterium CG23_combo_of_CG06-09_8_20_14_all_32_9]